MAKYKPIDMVKEYRGKICEHSDMYFFHEAIEPHRRMSSGHCEE